VLGDDKGLRKALALDFAESTTAIWSNIAVADLTHVLLTHPVECITVSDLTPDLRESLHNGMVHPGYLGGCEIDRGNPVMLKLASGLLVPYYQYSDGSLEVIKSFEGDDDAIPHWAKDMPFKAVRLAEISVAAIASGTLSVRGAKSVRLLENRGAPAQSEIVLSALLEQWEQDRASALDEAVQFGTKEQGVPVINVSKLTEYALNEEHPQGKHKARLFRDLLGITKNDWRFLAEQLVVGLRRHLVQKVRKSVHGVQYHIDVPVVGRNGKKKLVRSAWIIRENEPPSLTTALIPGAADTDMPAALANKIVTNSAGQTDWQTLYDTAHSAGAEAAANWTPMPMFVSGGIVEGEGECGQAWVQLTRKSGFGRWLLKNRLGDKGHPSGVWVFSNHPSQSVERAVKYCEAFASVVRANGIGCEVQSRLT
jgi:hypothetical protein